MPAAGKLFAKISRSEFLLPNLGSLIMGLAWGVTPPVDPAGGILSVALSFLIINLSSLIGAQANTLYDYDLDLKDERKKELVQALDRFGHEKVRNVMILEILLTLVLVSALALYMQEPILLALWIVGISLGVAFSAPPLRLKARFWIGPICQMLVLAVFPVLFAYYAFTSEVNAYFLVSLAGLSLTVYGVIVPTEIRDYFGDKAMGIQTLTVRLGLSRAAAMGIALLGAGAALSATALFLEWVRNQLSVLGVLVLAIPIVVLFVLSKFWKLYCLTRDFDGENTQDRLALEGKITNLSSENPKWIMLVTQTYMILSIILLITKFFL
ncbi:MAG: prenyltransferase [Candidatus Methanomethylicus sp.]|nr:prenyltransferase [Candidatus Methanomethylicus sp.]